MRNIKLTIEYDGTNYRGWQKQKNEKTIQGSIEKAINKLTGEECKVIGSSRTDAGVHARGMVANFTTNSNIPGSRFSNAINGNLPPDIAIIKSEEVAEGFHSTYCSIGKTYCYTIINRIENIALEKNYAYNVKAKLDIDKMKESCQYFIGTHDFKAFKTEGSSTKTTIRTIQELYIVQEGEKIKLYIRADGFLYNMVRIIVGTLIRVGNGKNKPEDIEEIISCGQRSKAGACAPPSGLVLEKVYY